MKFREEDFRFLVNISLLLRILPQITMDWFWSMAAQLKLEYFLLRLIPSGLKSHSWRSFYLRA